VMDNEPFMDTGFLMLRQQDTIPSPMAMLHYSYYQDKTALEQELKARENEIQCVVGIDNAPLAEVAPGAAQRPHLWDYADKVDTLEFLRDLDRESAAL